jgi:hypothetical protein
MNSEQYKREVAIGFILFLGILIFIGGLTYLSYRLLIGP